MSEVNLFWGMQLHVLWKNTLGQLIRRQICVICCWVGQMHHQKLIREPSIPICRLKQGQNFISRWIRSNQNWKKIESYLKLIQPIKTGKFCLWWEQWRLNIPLGIRKILRLIFLKTYIYQFSGPRLIVEYLKRIDLWWSDWFFRYDIGELGRGRGASWNIGIEGVRQSTCLRGVWICLECWDWTIFWQICYL